MKMQKTNKQERENGAAAAKKILEVNEEVSIEDVQSRSQKLSKQIRKCIREKKRIKREEKIQRILEDSKGIKNTPGINKSAKKNTHH